MKEKLLSILKDRRSGKGFTLKTLSGASEKSQKGFTLIELLVVIAIIAILVVIVVVAINPAERLREADDRRAASNVRASGTLLSVCVTRNDGALDACDTKDKIEASTGGDGDLAQSIELGVIGTVTELCVFEEGRADTWYIYSTDSGASEVASSVPSTTSCPNPT